MNEKDLFTPRAADPRAKMNGKPVFSVPARTAVNFESGFGKKQLCDSITFTAGNACVFDCVYCYVDDMQRKAVDWHKKHGVVYPPPAKLRFLQYVTKETEGFWRGHVSNGAVIL